MSETEHLRTTATVALANKASFLATGTELFACSFPLLCDGQRNGVRLNHPLSPLHVHNACHAAELGCTHSLQMHFFRINSSSQVAAARRRPIPVVCGERHGHVCDLITLRTDTLAGVPLGTTQRLVTRARQRTALHSETP